MMMTKFQLTIFFLILSLCGAQAQDVHDLLMRIKAKLDKVNDYTATGKLKTDIAFIKVPIANVQVLYKKPDRLRVKKEGGISIVPKGGLQVNLSNLLNTDHYAAVAAGEINSGNTVLKIIKLIPLGEEEEVVLTTLYVDEAQLLIRKTTTTTRDNGTYETELSYGKWAEWGLPDKLVFSFNTKNYKLPKGITFEYEDGEKPAQTEEMKNRKGKIEITYSNYIINQGISDAAFK